MSNSLSATTVISDGPAIIPSIPTSPNTSRFALATKSFPGPNILSTFCMYAKLPMAWAPPLLIIFLILHLLLKLSY